MPTPEAIKAAKDVFICSTDRETRHNIALALDRFAAQRGAEADDEPEPGELRPCPFCAGEAQRVEIEGGGSVIECSRCRASAPIHYDRCENLIPNWNSRVRPGAPPQTGGGWQGAVVRFAEAILHGNEQHQQWLRDAAKAYVSGNEIPLVPPQTGGGDAGERDVTRQAIWAYYGWDVDVNDIDPDSAEAATIERIDGTLRSSHREGAEEARQDALRAPFTKALVAEARTQGYREGAEAMRRDCDTAIRACPSVDENGYICTKDAALKAVRALPIPGKTE